MKHEANIFVIFCVEVVAGLVAIFLSEVAKPVVHNDYVVPLMLAACWILLLGVGAVWIVRMVRAKTILEGEARQLRMATDFQAQIDRLNRKLERSRKGDPDPP